MRVICYTKGIRNETRNFIYVTRKEKTIMSDNTQVNTGKGAESPKNTQITRSIRANTEDFEQLKAVAEKLGMSQGAAFSQLLASWELHHASDTMQEQAGAVKAVQNLLAQVQQLFVGQFAAMSSLEAEAKKASGVEVERLRRELEDSRKREEAARRDRDDAVMAEQQARNEAKAADDALAKVQAVTKEQLDQAKAAQGEAEKKAADATAALDALKGAADDARAERDAAKKAAEEAKKEADNLRDRAAACDMAERERDAAQAEVANLKADLKDEKAERRQAAADLTDLMKAVEGRIDKAVAEAVKTKELELRAEFNKSFNEKVKAIRKEAKEQAEQKIKEIEAQYKSE